MAIAAAIGPATPAQERAGVTDISPWLADREAAERRSGAPGGTVDASLSSRLASPSPAVRRAAARALLVFPAGAEPQPLVEALMGESDRLIQRDLAAALARHGAAGRAAFLASGGQDDSQAGRLCRHERVGHELRAIIAANTDPDGSFKGFYDEQFAALADLGAAADRVLVGLAGEATRSSILRRAAIRALGCTKRRDVTPALAVIRAAHLRRDGLVDPAAVPVWQLEAKAREDYWDDQIVEYVDYAAARCGDEVGIRERMRHFAAERERWTGALRFADGEQRKYVRGRIADTTFRVAYCNQQLGNWSVSESMLTILAVDWADTGYGAIAWYNLACIQSRAGRLDKALASLDGAIRNGYLDAAWIYKDGDLSRLRSDPRFAELMQRLGLARDP